MKTWKVWTTILLSVVVLSAGALTVAVWKNISTEWEYEGTAAQYALNHTPIDHLQTHDVFTGSGDEEVFSGIDTFGRRWFAFLSGTPFTVTSVLADGILTSKQIKTKVMSINHLKVISAHLGYLNYATTALFNTKSKVVWEVYGSVGNKNEYLYLDAYTGTVIWQPVYS